MKISVHTNSLASLSFYHPTQRLKLKQEINLATLLRFRYQRQVSTDVSKTQQGLDPNKELVEVQTLFCSILWRQGVKENPPTLPPPLSPHHEFDSKASRHRMKRFGRLLYSFPSWFLFIRCACSWNWSRLINRQHGMGFCHAPIVTNKRARRFIRHCMGIQLGKC